MNTKNQVYVLLFVLTIICPSLLFAKIKIENNLCFEESPESTPEHPHWKTIDVSECGINKKKPTRTEYNIVAGKCQKFTIFESSIGLGSIELQSPFETISLEQCGIQMSRKKTDYEFLQNRCWQIFIYPSEHSHINPLVVRNEEVALTYCGFNLNFPTNVVYELKKGFIFDSCIKKSFYESVTGKGSFTKTEDATSINDCKKH